MAETSTAPPDGYKTTELGPLPEEWEAVPLEEVAVFTRKPRGLRYSDFSEIPFIPMEGVPADGTFDCDLVPKPGGSISSGTYCEPGDVLLAKITPSLENGKQGIAPPTLPDGFAVATTEVYPLKPKHGLLDGYFLFSYLRHQPIRQNLSAKMEGSTGRQRLPKHVLGNLLLPLPPLPEQRAIARVLRTVQEAKETTEKVVASTKQLKKSLMRHLFTYGPVPVEKAEQVPLKETEIGPVLEHWDVVTLGEVARVGNGSTPKRTNEAYWVRGTMPWLTSAKVHETVIRQADEHVTELALEECHLPIVPEGSVVVAITGQGKTLGNAALVSFDTCISQHLAYLHFQVPHIVPEFVLAFLQQQYEALRRAGFGGGSTKGALTCRFLKSYPLPLPSVLEQQEIARALLAIDEKIAAEENRKRALEALFKTLLHNLMTGKLRVEVELGG